VADYEQLQARIGHVFQELGLLRLALTHPSVAQEAGGPKLDNQRLEFLGDAVLQLALSQELYGKFPAFGEGPLTKARAKLVNRHALAVHGRDLALGEHLSLSRGEELCGGRTRPSTLSDAFEAVVGAVLLDGGFEVARAFILRQLGAELAGLAAEPIIDNPKGELQELLQTDMLEPPEYRVVSATGPDHDRVFECTVLHRGLELARGCGKSKRLAESVAALNALGALRLAASTAGPAVQPAPIAHSLVPSPCSVLDLPPSNFPP
jgi:ribonuclease-3